MESQKKLKLKIKKVNNADTKKDLRATLLFSIKHNMHTHLRKQLRD